MPTKNTDELLKEYLEKRGTEESQGYTLQNVLLAQNEMVRLYKELKAGHVNHELRLNRHGQEIRSIKGVLRDKGIYDDGFGDVDTGQYQIADLRRAVAESQAKEHEAEARRLDSVIWWKRSAITWVVGGIGALVIATISAMGAYIFANLSKGK
jgi:hypothetical protein